jgi:ATP-binding cassette subfamily B protein
LAGQIVATLLNALVPVALVWLLKTILDALTQAGGAGASHRFPPSAEALIAVGLVAAALPSLTTYVHHEVERRVGRRAQSDLYLATARLPGLVRLEVPSFRDRLRLAQSAGRSAPGQVIDGTLGTAQLTISLAGLILVLASVGPGLAALVVAGMVPLLVAEIRLSQARARMLWQISPHERREFFYAELQTSLPAAKELRLLGLSELFRRRMLRELTIADRERRRIDGREVRVQLGLGLLTAAALGVAIAWSVWGALRGRITVGEVSAIVGGTLAAQTTLASLVSRVSLIYRALLMYDHYRAVLGAEPDLPLAAHPRPVPSLRRGIELRDVWFRYGPDQAWVLRGVNLVIPYGQAVALVGLNGAGKSTLIKLVCRFYDPDRGSIRWDGIDLRDLSIEGLRKRIGALFQDYMSYELTAAENIGLGDLATLDEPPYTGAGPIAAAAARAGIDQAIQALPRQYQTMLSRTFGDESAEVTGGAAAADPSAGVLLSGGQWQRLALARTFLRDRRDLLILDEPSSGLDAEAEHEIHSGLRRHRRGATSLLIAHRLGAIRDADTIAVLAGGAVVEQGNHSELMALGGEYARLFLLQAEGYRAEDAPVALP